ncbi:unnamed protein product [Trichobilharzia szidati]|nr:unnamed protein product [Trichobilharzia szidati]
MYLKTNPSPFAALWHFRIFALSRLLHTPAYLFTDGHEIRGPIFMAGYAVNLSLALQCLAYYL